MFNLSIIEPFFLNIMFSSLGLFKQVECPESSHCLLPSCIFSHNSTSNGRTVISGLAPDLNGHYHLPNVSDGHRKRQKASALEYEPPVVPPSAGAAALKSAQTSDSSRGSSTADLNADYVQGPGHEGLTAASRPISPPPLRSFKGGLGFKPSVTAYNGTREKPITPSKTTGTQSLAKIVPAESLNPRNIANAPAPHNTRLKLITLMHEQMVRLNELVKKSNDPSRLAMELSTPELVRTVLDEEQRTAKKNPAVYANVLKLRILALRKMDLSAWKQERLKVIETELRPEMPPKPIESKAFESGLSSKEEIAYLPRLVAKQENFLAKHGYVTSQLTDAQVKTAQEGLESANNWETCDRCATRFQVFPGRRAEDGALTTGGTCRHHPGKSRRPPPKDKADKSDRESVYLCCNEVVGRSAGCVTGPTHVFKVSEAKRLALILPFEETPPNETVVGSKTAVCFDCEMGYTTYGMELIRLTATSFPYGSVLLDTLVRPLGEVLDLNSRYSGVWPNDFMSAIPSDRLKTPVLANGETEALPIASSPAVARSLLFNLISPTTPLIGHALENDLNATRIIHPSIVDTCLLFPHFRGLPMRHGLKALMKKYLDKDVQVNNDGKGHDSAEDARSAGELVRVKIKEMVAREAMRANGEMNGTAGTKRSVVGAGADAVKRGMASVGEVLRRVS